MGSDGLALCFTSKDVVVIGFEEPHDCDAADCLAAPGGELQSVWARYLHMAEKVDSTTENGMFDQQVSCLRFGEESRRRRQSEDDARLPEKESALSA